MCYIVILIHLAPLSLPIPPFNTSSPLPQSISLSIHIPYAHARPTEYARDPLYSRALLKLTWHALFKRARICYRCDRMRECIDGVRTTYATITSEERLSAVNRVIRDLLLCNVSEIALRIVTGKS
ncbi:hypothetical protein Tco_1182727 [Tanacetum coccineum]